MAEYSNLSATINAQIRANGVQAITGPVLNAVLTAMVNVLGDGYRLNGVAVLAAMAVPTLLKAVKTLTGEF